MQIIYLNYFLASIISYLGLLLGVILIRLAPEEQKPGKKYFILLKKLLFFLILAFLLFFYKIHAILSLALLATVLILMLNKKINLNKSSMVYFLLGIVFYLSYFSGILDLFVVESSLIFIYGIPSASLDLKKNGYLAVFVKNLWFFAPIISLYLIF